MSILPGMRFAILHRDKWTCRYCGRKSPKVALEVDHILPVVHGGSDDATNLVAACEDCNAGKSDKLLRVPVPGKGPSLVSVTRIRTGKKRKRKMPTCSFGDVMQLLRELPIPLSQLQKFGVSHDKELLAEWSFWGISLRHGVEPIRLEHLFVGGSLRTTIPAYLRFLRKLNGIKP